MSEWRDHEVFCANGCGTVLEDHAGNVINEAVQRFENTDKDGTPILLLLCAKCAAEPQP